MRHGLDAFGDDELTALLNDLPIGQDVATLEDELGAPLGDLTSFTVVADLPAGDISSTGDPTVDDVGNRQVFRWERSLGDPPAELRARTGEVDWLVLALAVLSLFAFLALVILMLRRLMARRRPMTVATSED